MPNTPFIFCCGNDDFGGAGTPAAATITAIYTTSTSMAITAGRLNGFSLLFDSFASQVTKSFAPKTTAAILFAFRIDTPQFANVPFLQLLDAGATVQIGIGINAAQQLFVFRNSTANILATSTEAFSSGVYFQVEFQFTISNAAGSIEVRLNGNPTPIIAASGIDTQQSASNTVSVFQFQSGGNLDIAIDDVILREADGLTPTSDWLGNCHIETTRVTANGSINTWSAVGAGSAFQCVDENPPNGNTDYVASSVVGDSQLFQHAAATASPSTIYAVQLWTVSELDAAGASTYNPVFYNGAEFLGTAIAPTAGSYAGFSQLWMENPSTGVDWVLADFNAGEFGVKVAS